MLIASIAYYFTFYSHRHEECSCYFHPACLVSLYYHPSSSFPIQFAPRLTVSLSILFLYVGSWLFFTHLL